MAQGVGASKPPDHEFELVRNTSVPADAPKGDIESARLREGHEPSAVLPNNPWQASQRKATGLLGQLRASTTGPLHSISVLRLLLPKYCSLAMDASGLRCRLLEVHSMRSILGLDHLGADIGPVSDPAWALEAEIL